MKKTIDSIQPVYGIGIDVGKEELVTACRSSHSGLGSVTPTSFSNDSIGLKKFFDYFKTHNLPKNTPILLESTGPYHWFFAYELTQAGYNAKVVNPLHTKHALKHSIRKRKTDKVDAFHLAMLAYQGYGYTFRDNHDLAKMKALVRHYWYLKIQRANNVKRENYLKNYRNIQDLSLTPLLDELIKEVEQELLKYSKDKNVEYLDSIPGVTPIIAITLLAELYPLERFRRVEEIIALAGLDPQIKQTGGKASRFGKLSKRGSANMRRVLYYAAFGSFKKAPFLSYYDKYKARGLHHTAVLIILSRKILKISWALLKKKHMFNVSFLT